MEEILSLSDRIIVMNEGEIKGELLASSASQENILKLAFKH
jgi:putative multiple sugar transport system ATP-binding protein